MEMMTAAKQASPSRQSNTKNSASIPTIMAMEPAVSGSLCANSPSVSAAQPSTTRRSAPEACVSKYPSEALIRCAVVCLRMFAAQRNAARCVHISAAKYTRMLATANPSAAHP